MTPLFIAEVKTKSPFGFESEHSWNALFELAAEHGDAVAIHTSSRWGGSFDHVRQAREKLLRRKLVVAKGIHPYDEEIRIALFRGGHPHASGLWRGELYGHQPGVPLAHA